MNKDFQQLKNKSLPELQKDLKEQRVKLRDLKFELAAGKVKNVSEIQKIKKSIAQILTLIKSEQNA